MNAIIGSHDIVFITLDTLRFDVASQALREGRTPCLGACLPKTGWERRHSPANFTYAAHHAFFSGFLPTPREPGPHPRLFAAAFPGSETTTPNTFCFEETTLVEALGARGYHTICIGGVGFFNKRTALGRQLPDLFAESHWSEELGVTCRDSTEHQTNLALDRCANAPASVPKFVFINVSALHQPNCIYVADAKEDSPATQAAALAYVDAQLGRFFQRLQFGRPAFAIICSDHGTAYGENGYVGHRLNHQVVGDVPYVDFRLSIDGAVSWNPL